MDPIKQLYEYLDAQNKAEVDNFTKPSARFRLSELDDCPRATFYRHSGVRPMAAPGFISLYGQDGDICHDSVRWLLKRAGVELDGLEFNETDGSINELLSFTKDMTHKGEKFVISGRADGLIKVDGEWMLLEIKSVDGMKWKYLSKAWAEGKLLDYMMTGNHGKYRKYVMQSEGGMRMLGFDKTYIIFKDRSLCQIGCHNERTREIGGYVLEKDDARWKGLLDNMAYITRCHKKNEPPMRLVEGSYACGICQFRDTCGRL